MSLVEAYKDYYNYDTKELLWYEIINYDWVNYESDLDAIFRFKKIKENISVEKLVTSGSTGPQIDYTFGPHWHYWLVVLESYLKNRSGLPVVFLHEAYDYLIGRRLSQCYFGVDRHMMDPCGVVMVRLDLKNPDKGIIDFLNVYGPFSIQTYPKIIFGLTEKLNGVVNSTLSEAFYRSNSHVNDNNISWDSGFNFYTCEFGVKHILPIFHIVNDECYSLLNCSSPKGSSSDLIRLGDWYTCKCGKNTVELDFIPHIRNQPRKLDRLLYDLNLPNRLAGHYTNFQIIESDDEILCLYEGDMCDEKLLMDFGVDRFIANSYCCTARQHYKMATFFKITNTDKIIKYKL